ncbi:MAG: hypothetical protein ACUVTL_09945 [Thermoproteota archaeon]
MNEVLLLERLIWYLDSGGRRSWIVIEKPDEVQEGKVTGLCVI